MRSIGPYQLHALLGRGGMGEVYVARDTRRHREVAIKILDPHLAADREDVIERFRREGELLRSIHHRNLPRIYEVGMADGGEAYLVMEYLRGERLTEWIGRSPLDTIPLLIQICEGLREIADRGIVHRDLSPDNVLVVQQGRHFLAKIIDFGIAKDLGRTTELTSTGYFFGKLQYCSPEHVGVLGEGEIIDWRSDLYSFGLVAYHVLSGRLPFRASTPVGFVSAHLHDKPRPLEPAPGQAPYPRRLTDLLSWILEKDRARRPGSYDDVIGQLALSHAQILLSFSGRPSRPADREMAPIVKLEAGAGGKPPTAGKADEISDQEN